MFFESSLTILARQFLKFVSTLGLWQVSAVATLTVATCTFPATDGNCAHFCMAESFVISVCYILDCSEYIPRCYETTVLLDTRRNSVGLPAYMPRSVKGCGLIISPV